MKRRGELKRLFSSTLQRITTPGFCLNASSLQETCLQRSQGNVCCSSQFTWSLCAGGRCSFPVCLDSCSEVWARFLAFESNIGDLASILKVERRRFSAFKDEYEGKETALLVDRYKFMDLYPCSTSELKALGYKVQTTPTRLILLLSSLRERLGSVFTGCVSCQTGSNAPRDCGGALRAYIKG